MQGGIDVNSAGRLGMADLQHFKIQAQPFCRLIISLHQSQMAQIPRKQGAVRDLATTGGNVLWLARHLPELSKRTACIMEYLHPLSRLWQAAGKLSGVIWNQIQSLDVD